MKQGFIKVAAATPDIRVADVAFNTEEIIKRMREAAGNGARIIVFPELCVTGYTCGDLFTQDALLETAKGGLLKITEATRDLEALVFVGCPIAVDGELYNTAAALNKGMILGFTTKTFLPNYGEFYEMRQFTPGPDVTREIAFDGKRVPFGPQILFVSRETKDLVVSAEIWSAHSCKLFCK